MEEQCRASSIRSIDSKCSAFVHACLDIPGWSRIGRSRSDSPPVSNGRCWTAHVECIQCRRSEVGGEKEWEKMHLYDIRSTSEITAREFLGALPAKRLTPQKLRCLNDLARGLLMQIPGLIVALHFVSRGKNVVLYLESRPIILKVIVTDVSMLCNHFVTEKQNSDDFRLSMINQQSSNFLIDPKDRDQLSICSKIVGHIMNHLFIRKVHPIDEHHLPVEFFLSDFGRCCHRRGKTSSSIHADPPDRPSEGKRPSGRTSLNDLSARIDLLDQFCDGYHCHSSNDGWWALCGVLTTDGWHQFAWFLSGCLRSDQRSGHTADLLQRLVRNAALTELVRRRTQSRLTQDSTSMDLEYLFERRINSSHD